MKRLLALLLAICMVISILPAAAFAAEEEEPTEETVQETVPEKKTETVPETEPATEPETVPETEPATEPETVPETEPVTEPATEPVTEPVPEKETEPAATEPETPAEPAETVPEPTEEQPAEEPVSAGASSEAMAEEEEDDGEYDDDDEEVEPSYGEMSYSKEGTKLTITGSGILGPIDADVINGVTEVVIGEGITGIGRDVFYSNDYVETVTLPSTLETIGNRAFAGSGITEITIPSGVWMIGEQAFAGNSSLRTVRVSPAEYLKSYEDAFADCTNIKSVYVDSLSQWLDCIFETATANPLYEGGADLYVGGELLTDLVIPEKEMFLNPNLFCGSTIKSAVFHENVPDIPCGMFENCKQLESVKLSSDMEGIGRRAFYGTALRSVEIGRYVEGIESETFAECAQLESVKFGSGLAYIEYGAFRGSGITSVVLGDKVRSIDGYAFADCKQLQTVTLGSSIETIGDSAFNGCSALTTVDIGSGVKDMGICAFQDCTSLTGITLPDSLTYVPAYAFQGCESLAYVEMGSAVHTIEDSAFAGCTNLDELTIPASVETICDNAFAFSSWNNLYFAGNAPVISSYAFGFASGNIWVPEGNATWSSVRTEYEEAALTWHGLALSEEELASEQWLRDALAKNKDTWFYLDRPVTIHGTLEISNLSFDIGEGGSLTIAADGELILMSQITLVGGTLIVKGNCNIVREGGGCWGMIRFLADRYGDDDYITNVENSRLDMVKFVYSEDQLRATIDEKSIYDEVEAWIVDSFPVSSDLSVPEGVVVSLNGEHEKPVVVTVEQDVTLLNYGTIVVDEQSILRILGTAKNYGYMEIANRGCLEGTVIGPNIRVRENGEDIGQLTVDLLKEMLADPENNWIEIRSPLTVDQDLTIPEGKELQINGSSLKVSEGATLTVEGSLYSNYSTVVIEGTLNSLSENVDFCSCMVTISGTANIQKHLGLIDCTKVDIPGTVYIAGDEGVSFYFENCASVTISGKIDIAGWMGLMNSKTNITGTINVLAGGEACLHIEDSNVTIAGQVNDNRWVGLFNSTVKITGAINVDEDAYLDIDGTTVTGASNIHEAYRNYVSSDSDLRAALKRDGWEIIMLNSFKLSKSLTLPENHGLFIRNGCKLTVPSGMTLTAKGEIHLLGGKLSVSGTFKNHDANLIFNTSFYPELTKLSAATNVAAKQVTYYGMFRNESELRDILSKTTYGRIYIESTCGDNLCNITLSSDLTIPAKTEFVLASANLTIPNGVSVTNNGAIVLRNFAGTISQLTVENGGKLINKGTISMYEGLLIDHNGEKTQGSAANMQVYLNGLLNYEEADLVAAMDKVDPQILKQSMVVAFPWEPAQIPELLKQADRCDRLIIDCFEMGEDGGQGVTLDVSSDTVIPENVELHIYNASIVLHDGAVLTNHGFIDNRPDGILDVTDGRLVNTSTSYGLCPGTIVGYGMEIHAPAAVFAGKTGKAMVSFTKAEDIWIQDQVYWYLEDTTAAIINHSTGLITGQRVTEPTVVKVHAVTDNACEEAVQDVTIYPKATGVAIYKDDVNITGKTYTVNINESNTINFDASCLPWVSEDADARREIDGQRIKWTISTTSYGKIRTNADGSCTVYGMKVSAGKTATVTLKASATDGSGKYATMKLKIIRAGRAGEQDVTITNAADDMQLRGGAAYTFKASINPGLTYSSKTLAWSVKNGDVSDTAVHATITSTGKLTTKPVTEPTTILVTAAFSIYKDCCDVVPVTLMPAVSGVEIQSTIQANEGIISLNKNQGNGTIQLDKVITPANAIQNVKWTVSPATVAAIDENGLLTFKTAGTATVTCAAADGSGVSASVKVCYGIPVAGITLTAPQTELTSGDVITLDLAIANEDATQKKILWESSNPAVATVSAAGVVTAKAIYTPEPQTVTITAKTTDGTGFVESVELTVNRRANVIAVFKGEDIVNGKTITVKKSSKTLSLTCEDVCTWSTSKSTVATVGKTTGKVTFKGTGTVKITAKTADGKTGYVTLKIK